MSRRLVVPSLLVAVLSLIACQGAETDAAAAAAPVTVEIVADAIALAETAVISSGPLLSGTLVADRTAQIRAEVPGSVVQVLVDEGSPVATGASLARIDDRAISDAFLSARS
ncbi:MAG: biotin/lipoyl-binding protein, partial [Gemmatimonadota bacterium]